MDHITQSGNSQCISLLNA